MRAVEYALTCDQVGAMELSFVGLLLRHPQLVEYRCKHRPLETESHAGTLLAEEFWYSGVGETRGLMMPCPFFGEH
eukprot:3201835-Pyramimonas_sp.AAC.1